MAGKPESNEPPQQQASHHTDNHPVGGQILHHDQGDQNPKEHFHFFFKAFQI